MGMNKSDLKGAFRESVSNDFQSVPRNESQVEYEFSDSFEKKMSKLVRSEKKKSWHWFNTPYKRVALIVAILMMLFVTACSVPAIREGVVNFIINTFDIGHKITFEGDLRNEIEQVYSLTYLPDGFTQSEEYKDDASRSKIYYGANKQDYIHFYQRITDSTEIRLDNEYGSMEKIVVNEFDVYLYTRSDSNFLLAQWIQDGYVMKLSWKGTVDQETMIKMVESVAPVE